MMADGAERCMNRDDNRKHNNISVNKSRNDDVEEDRHWDPLMPYLSSASPTTSLSSSSPTTAITAEQVQKALTTVGYCILPSIVTAQDCDTCIDLIWDFIHDTSSGYVKRSDPSTWYQYENHHDDDPWPSTGNRFSEEEKFQSNGAGWLLGCLREVLAERVFEPIYGTRQLHSSKEGFMFDRPANDCPVSAPTGGEQYAQDHECKGLYMIQSMVALEDQLSDDGDGHFLCYPKSFGRVHQQMTADIISSKPNQQAAACIPLTDKQINRLTEEFGLRAERVYLRKGDVLLWRSDLVHKHVRPTRSPRFCAVSYCSMQPASRTSPNIWKNKKMDAYKQRQTGDHRSGSESCWYQHQKRNVLHRPYYRTSPPLVTLRQAELYGLLPYHKDSDQPKDEDIQRALVRGVRFSSSIAEQVAHRDQQLTMTTTTQRPVRRCEAHLVNLTATDEDEMARQGFKDKYLGGMASPCGRYVYGVPGTAKRVLRIRIPDGNMDWIGPSYVGKFKWLRGVEVPADCMNNHPSYPSGCCVALPCNDMSILKINPATDEVSIFGMKQLQEECADCGGWMYHGGNLAPSNGFVYCIPANAPRILKFNPLSNELEFIGPKFPGKQKWFGGIIGPDGCVYGIPHNHAAVLKIDPSTDEVSLLLQDKDVPLPDGHWKWHGGLRAGHKIYGFPNNADQVLVIDCLKNRVYTVGNSDVLKSGRHRIPQDNRYKYLGGALTKDERYAYLFPCDAERVLRIDCISDELKLVGPPLLDGENKFQNGFLAPRDSCLYGIPQRATGILRIVPKGTSSPEVDDGEEEIIDIIDCDEGLSDIKDKFEGGVMGDDGCIYCMPLRSDTCVKVVPASPSC